MQLLSVLVACAFVAVLLGHERWLVPSGDDPATAIDRRWTLLAPLAAGVLAVVVRLLFVAPSFTHDNFHSGELLDAIFGQSPDEPRIRSYGPVGFVLLGASTSLFGATSDVVLRTNLVFGSLALWVFGAYFARVFDRPRVTTLTLLAGALYPPLARIAFSEDFHGITAFFCGSCLLYLDRCAARRTWVDGTLAVLAAAAMLSTRQTFVLFAPCAVGLVLATHGLAVASSRVVLVTTATILALFVVRVVASLGNETDAGTLVAMAALLEKAAYVGLVLREHVLFDVARSGAFVVPLLVAGLYVGRRRPASRAMALVLLAQLGLTISFYRNNPGSELCMRSPLLFPAIAYVAVGLDALCSRIAARAPEPVAFAVVAALALLGPIATPGARADLHYQSIEYQEYAYLESVATQLPRSFRLLEFDRSGWHSRIELPPGLFAVRGVHVRPFHDPAQVGAEPGPVLFFEGLGCWTYSMQELFGLTEWDRSHFEASPRRPAFIDAMARQQVPAEHAAPTTIRPACAEVLRHATPLPIPVGRLVAHEVAPFAHFGRAIVPLRWYRLDDAALSRP